MACTSGGRILYGDPRDRLLSHLSYELGTSNSGCTRPPGYDSEPAQEGNGLLSLKRTIPPGLIVVDCDTVGDGAEYRHSNRWPPRHCSGQNTGAPESLSP
jgi:hypothetical protein